MVIDWLIELNLEIEWITDWLTDRLIGWLDLQVKCLTDEWETDLQIDLETE